MSAQPPRPHSSPYSYTDLYLTPGTEKSARGQCANGAAGPRAPPQHLGPRAGSPQRRWSCLGSPGETRPPGLSQEPREAEGPMAGERTGARPHPPGPVCQPGLEETAPRCLPGVTTRRAQAKLLDPGDTEAGSGKGPTLSFRESRRSQVWSPGLFLLPPPTPEAAEQLGLGSCRLRRQQPPRPATRPSAVPSLTGTRR